MKMRKFLKYVFTLIKVGKLIKSGRGPLTPPTLVEVPMQRTVGPKEQPSADGMVLIYLEKQDFGSL